MGQHDQTNLPLECTQHVAAGAGNGKSITRMREGVMHAQYLDTKANVS